MRTNEDDPTPEEMAQDQADAEDAEQTDDLEAVGYFDQAIADVMVPVRPTRFVPLQGTGPVRWVDAKDTRNPMIVAVWVDLENHVVSIERVAGNKTFVQVWDEDPYKTTWSWHVSPHAVRVWWDDSLYEPTGPYVVPGP